MLIIIFRLIENLRSSSLGLGSMPEKKRLPRSGCNFILIKIKNPDKMMGHSWLYLNRIISGTLEAMTGLKIKA